MPAMRCTLALRPSIEDVLRAVRLQRHEWCYRRRHVRWRRIYADVYSSAHVWPQRASVQLAAELRKSRCVDLVSYDSLAFVAIPWMAHYSISPSILCQAARGWPPIGRYTLLFRLIGACSAISIDYFTPQQLLRLLCSLALPPGDCGLDVQREVLLRQFHYTPDITALLAAIISKTRCRNTARVDIGLLHAELHEKQTSHLIAIFGKLCLPISNLERSARLDLRDYTDDQVCAWLTGLSRANSTGAYLPVLIEEVMLRLPRLSTSECARAAHAIASFGHVEMQAWHRITVVWLANIDCANEEWISSMIYLLATSGACNWLTAFESIISAMIGKLHLLSPKALTGTVYALRRHYLYMKKRDAPCARNVSMIVKSAERLFIERRWEFRPFDYATQLHALCKMGALCEPPHFDSLLDYMLESRIRLLGREYILLAEAAISNTQSTLSSRLCRICDHIVLNFLPSGWPIEEGHMGRIVQHLKIRDIEHQPLFELHANCIAKRRRQNDRRMKRRRDYLLSKRANVCIPTVGQER